MQLANFYHRHHFHRLAGHSDLRFFELAIWLHTLAHSLVGIFVPILLLTSGYSIGDTLIYYLIFNIFDIPLNFVVNRLIYKIGARKVLILSTLTTIAFFGILGILPPANWNLLVLMAGLAALYDTLFWVSHMYLFIEANKRELDTGKSVGTLECVRKLGNVAGPIIGALALMTVGKISLIVISIVMFTLSMIPLFKMKHVNDFPSEKKKTGREFFTDLKEKKNYFSMALWGVHNEVDGILWPVFIFTIFGTIGSVAAVLVIVSLSTAIFSYLTGRLSRKYGVKMIILGCLVIAMTWVSRMVFHNTSFYYVTIFIIGFFSLLVSVPLDENIIARGLKIGPLATATYRNVSSMILRIPLYIALIVLFEVFKVSFGIAALSLFLIILGTIYLNWKINKSKVNVIEND